MRVPQVQIQTTPARLGLNITKPQQTIRQPQADQSIEQPRANMSIRQRPGKLSIDQTKAWNNLGLESMPVRTEKFTSKAKQNWLEGVGRRAQQGKELMQIENEGNPLAAQAKQNSVLDFTLYQPGNIPAHAWVDISYQPGGADISVEPQAPRINTVPRKAETSYQPGEVNAYMEQYPDIQIDWKV
ncbi:DUF6470 family protein [Virgibacillus sediminis]|uniref:DUF6470 family protein n=1 Tax=Virgibacillus sediminis TaxID=202260 RepID=A0ABV7A8D2_9BACI